MLDRHLKVQALVLEGAGVSLKVDPVIYHNQVCTSD